MVWLEVMGVELDILLHEALDADDSALLGLLQVIGLLLASGIAQGISRFLSAHGSSPSQQQQTTRR
jgi:hypothetical protein